MGKIKGKYGKAFEVADLKTISPGVKVNKNYKPGEDAPLDAVLDKLKNDGPGSLDRSAFIAVRSLKNETKNKTKPA